MKTFREYKYYIKQIFSKADQLAYADLTQDPNEDSFEGSLGAYENSENVRIRFNNVATDLGIQQIITKSQGEPVNMDLPIITKSQGEPLNMDLPIMENNN